METTTSLSETQEIPIFIYHIGDQDYFKKCVNFNSKHNKVYVVGMGDNPFNGNPNVSFYDVRNMNNGEANRFKRCFKNYSSHTSSYEIKCFVRVFILKQLMLLTKINQFLHLDSDCILLCKTSEIFNNPSSSSYPRYIKSAYSIQKFAQEENPYHMVGCIHNGLLDLQMCNTFIQLCYDIYENNSKFHLIEDKVKFHEGKNNGGINDMTMFWVIYNERLYKNEK